MPYINQMDRRLLDNGDLPPHTAGELNYLITRMVVEYLARKGVSYTNLNEVVGVLECAKQELYRRVVAPYEESKRSENGDVYESGPKRL